MKIVELLNKKNLIFFILAFALILRIIVSLFTPVYADGALYAEVGLGISQGKGFSTQDGESAWGWSLTYPLFTAIFYSIFGFSIFTIKAAAIAASLLTIVVAYICTKDLFGLEKANVIAIVMAFLPWQLYHTAGNYCESFVILFTMLLVWALFKVKEKHSYFILVGVFGVLALWTRSNIGWPLLLIAALGATTLLYLSSHSNILRSPYYYIFLAIVATGGGIREYLIQVNSVGVSEMSNFVHLVTFDGLVQLAFQIPLTLLISTFILLFFLPEVKRISTNWKGWENGLVILLNVGAFAIILSHAFVGSKWIFRANFEGPSIRYYLPFFIPTLWMVLSNIVGDDSGKEFLFKKESFP